MQMCPGCDRVYDEEEYSECPYCSGLIEKVKVEKFYKACPNCDGTMLWYDGVWSCDNCGEDIESDIDDNDGTVCFDGYEDDL